MSVLTHQPMTGRLRIHYQIGADPELFVVNTETGKVVSAHALLPGNKHEPFPVPSGAVQPDGTAAEFNIYPAEGSLEFTKNIREVLRNLDQMIKAKDSKLSLQAFPVANFDKEYFDGLPPEALQFGCDPDFNAWDEGKENEFVGTDQPFRTGAGHIHVGWTDHQAPFEPAHFFDCIQATKQLDAALYFASLLWDTDEKRRTLYGKMGSFRPKKYGVEYRPLSNVWVGDVRLHVFIFRTADAAMNLLDYHDLRLWEDSRVKDMIKRVQDGNTPQHSELVKYHLDLVDRFRLPALPSRYVPLSDKQAA